MFDNATPAAPAVSAAAILPYVSISGSSVAGTSVLFDVKAALAANPTWRIQSEGTQYNFGMDARGGCATPNSFSITGRQIGHLFKWPSALSEASYNDSARTQSKFYLYTTE